MVVQKCISRRFSYNYTRIKLPISKADMRYLLYDQRRLLVPDKKKSATESGTKRNWFSLFLLKFHAAFNGYRTPYL